MSLLERNLEALRRWMPECASLVAAASILPGFEPAMGTDGSITYRRIVPTEGGRRVEWLGGTSMPRSSAVVLAEGLDAAAGNGLGLSIGTGHEWAAFAQRLSSSHAIFVYEADPALLRMALEVSDLSPWLASGKIVVVSGPAPEAGQALSDFLATHVGFEPPSVLHPLSTLPAERRNSYLAAGENMVRRVVQERYALNEQLALQLEAGMAETTDVVLAMTVTPRYLAERPRRHASESASAMLVVDRHDSASIALRLRTMAEFRPRKIVSDLFRTQLGCVPPACAVETWVPPQVGPGYWDRLVPASTLLPVDRVVVHGESQRGRLGGLGFSSENIVFRALPVDVATSTTRGSDKAFRVGLFGDLIELTPEKLGVTLPTHIAVLEAAAEIIRDDFLGAHEGMAGDILRRAIARSNVVATPEGATDPALREPMLRLVRDVLIPNLPLIALAQAMMMQGVPSCLMGDWPGVAAIADADVRFSALTADHWHDVALFVHLSPTGMPSPVLWEAVAAGVPIVAPQQATDRLPGALPTLLKADVEFSSLAPKQLLAGVKALLKDGDRRGKLATAALQKWSALQEAQRSGQSRI